MGTSPRRIGGRQELPDFVGGEIDDRTEDHAADKVVMRVEAMAVVVALDRSCPGCALVAPYAEQEDCFPGRVDLASDVAARRLNLHPVRAPPEGSVR